MKEQQNITKKQLDTGFPFTCYGEYFALCGQPQKEDLEEFKEKSWTHIINLRSPQELNELGFDMSKACGVLALSYSHIPIIVNRNIDKKALETIHDLLSKASEKQKFVIHCASGARSAIALLSHLILSKSYEVSQIPTLAEELDLYQPEALARLFRVLKVSL